MTNELPVPNLDHDEEDIAPTKESKSKAPRNNEVQELLVWDAPNRIFDPKSAQWFLSLFAIGLLLIIGFAIIREIWLILLTAATIFVYYAIHRVEPAEIEHRVLSSGIEVGGRLYAWEDLESFWIVDLTDPAILRIETKLFLPHVLELILPDDTPEEDLKELKQLISGYIPAVEKPHSDSGNVADNAIMTVYRLIPFRGKMSGWLESKLNIK